MDHNNFILPITKNAFCIMTFLQNRMTITGYFRRKGLLNERVRTLNNLIWLFLSSQFVIVSAFNSKLFMSIILIFPIYRLWEILIINIWMFVFVQGSEKPERCTALEANVRLFILLMVQYTTIVLIYSFIYSYIFTMMPDSFNMSRGLVASSPSALAWIYHSLGVMTNQSYGIIQPATDLSRIVTASQVIYGLSYMLLFISIVLGNFRFYWHTPRRRTYPRKANYTTSRRVQRKT